jgi:hypothetical protein
MKKKTGSRSRSWEEGRIRDFGDMKLEITGRCISEDFEFWMILEFGRAVWTGIINMGMIGT